MTRQLCYNKEIRGDIMSRTIGILIGRPYYTINRPQLSGILNECRSRGDNACVFTVNEEFYDERALHQEWNLLQAIHYEGLDGLIYLPYTIGRDDTKAYILAHIEAHCTCPVVMVCAEDSPYMSVWFDEGAPFEALVTHLIEAHGCRDILCLTGPAGMQTSRSRADGWRAALRRAGLPAPANRLVYGDFWENAPRALVQEFINGTRSLPEAVVCGNDRMAVTLCDALTDAGIRVPEDVYVTGFDGITEADLHNPSVTTAMPDWETLGRLAVCRLYGQLGGTEEAPAVGYRILCAESCGHRRPPALQEALHYNTLESRYLDTAIHTLSLSDENAAALIGSIYASTFFYAATNHPEQAEFTLCLCSDWNRTVFAQESEQYRTQGYSETMLRMEHDGTGTPFPLARMVPWDVCPAPSVVFFVPLYFRDRCFGYSLLRFHDVADSYDLYYLKFCREVSSALAFFCLQNDYRSFAYRRYIRDCRDDLTGLYLFEKSRRICEENTAAARLYGETLCLIAVRLNGLQQIEDTQSRMDRDKLLLAVSDLLIRCCRGHEQVFLADEGVFYIIGSFSGEQERAGELHRQITEGFSGTPHPQVVWLASTVRLMDTAALGDLSDIPEILHEMADSLSHVPQPSCQEMKHHARLAALREEIYAHPEQPWTVEQCARRMNMSPSYFLKMYRNGFDTSCSQDIQRSKLAYAKKLLLQTDMILQDIADRCGYDYSHFMRLFKREVGMTPTAYRRGSST